MSKNCGRCRQWKARRRSGAISQEEYQAWKADDGPDWDVNTAASSPGMEAVGVWMLCSLVYTSYYLSTGHYIFNRLSQSQINILHSYVHTPVQYPQQFNRKSLRSRHTGPLFEQGPLFFGRPLPRATIRAWAIIRGNTVRVSSRLAQAVLVNGNCLQMSHAFSVKPACPLPRTLVVYVVGVQSAVAP